PSSFILCQVLTVLMMTKYEGLFESFLSGGFECSTHYLPSGKRLDEIAATKHDILAKADYLRLHQLGIKTAREGIRWHLIEQQPGKLDFSSALEQKIGRAS